MKEVFAGFLKEKIRGICLVLGFAGTFYVVFSLYNIDTEAVHYALLLNLFFLILYEVSEFIRYMHRHEKLLDAEQRSVSGFDMLPVPSGMIEEDYQRILHDLYREKQEEESASRISRQEMTDYYAMWVHQVKTPIAALRVLLQTFDETEAGEERKLARAMKLEVFKIEQYVDMVLTYLRMESMSSDMVLEIYSFDDIIRQAVKKYSQMFILQKISLHYEPIKRKVLTDEKWVVFVLEQILSNALKYTAQGDTSIREVSVYMEGEFLVVRDTGIGIWPEDLPRVFEKGFTGYNGRSDKKSTGIGLYLCKSVMDKLQHTIKIESEPGRGTKVYLGFRREKLYVE